MKVRRSTLKRETCQVCCVNFDTLLVRFCFIKMISFEYLMKWKNSQKITKISAHDFSIIYVVDKTLRTLVYNRELVRYYYLTNICMVYIKGMDFWTNENLVSQFQHHLISGILFCPFYIHTKENSISVSGYLVS